MSAGYRWLAAGALSLALTAPGEAQTPNRDMNAAPAPRSSDVRASQQGAYQAPSAIRPGQQLSVLVFPFGFGTPPEPGAAAPPANGAAPAAPGVVPPVDPATPLPDDQEPIPVSAGGLTPNQEAMSAAATGAVKGGLLSTRWFTVTTYNPQSSLIRRAVKDEILRPEHTTGLISTATNSVDVDKAQLVAQRLGLQAVLVGTLEVTENRADNSAEVTLLARLINSVTGEVISQAGVSGAAKEPATVSSLVVQERAAQKAGLALLPELGIQLVTPAVAAAAAPAARSGAPVVNPARTRTRTRAGVSPAQTDAERAARKAAQDAEDEARAAQKAIDRARRDAEREAEKARKGAERGRIRSDRPDGATRASDDRSTIAQRFRERAAAASAPLNTATDQEDSGPAPSVQPAVAAAVAAAQAAQPGVVTPAAPAPNGVQTTPAPTAPVTTAPATTTTGVRTGSADAAGLPIPYGYALTERRATGNRRRLDLKVPPWLGLVGFVSGVGFLLR